MAHDSICCAKHGKTILRRVLARGGELQTADEWRTLLQHMEREQEEAIDEAFDALVCEMEKVISAHVAASTRGTY